MASEVRTASSFQRFSVRAAHPQYAVKVAFLGKLFSNAFPLVVAQAQHAGVVIGLFSSAQLS
jgi:hypothetical protein